MLGSKKSKQKKRVLQNQQTQNYASELVANNFNKLYSLLESDNEEIANDVRRKRNNQNISEFF